MAKNACLFYVQCKVSVKRFKKRVKAVELLPNGDLTDSEKSRTREYHFISLSFTSSIGTIWFNWDEEICTQAWGKKELNRNEKPSKRRSCHRELILFDFANQSTDKSRCSVLSNLIIDVDADIHASVHDDLMILREKSTHFIYDFEAE